MTWSHESVMMHFMSQTIGCTQFKRSNVKEWTLRKIRNMRLPIFKLLSQLLHSNNVKFIITVVVVAQKTYYLWINFVNGKSGNEQKCKFQLISIPKIRLRIKNSNFCVISESHSILSLCLSGLMEPRFFFKTSKNFTPKMFTLFWRPRYSKLQKNA